MSSSNVGSEIEGELLKEKQDLLERLSHIFDPQTARDYVWPKTNENRQQLSLEELRRLNYNEHEENLQRLRSLGHYQTTTQSLSRADLEASYQAFVRNELAQQSPRYELEQFVRNSSDIDSAKHYLDMANDVLINPQQSLLLFRSSKLNEQKANLLKLSGYSNSLQDLNNVPSVQKYFPQTLNNTSRYPTQDEEEFFLGNKQNPSPRPQSMHLEHKDKKYHIKFLKDYDQHNKIYGRKDNSSFLQKKPFTTKNAESLISTDDSTIRGQTSEFNTSSIHRETFPPLTLTALKEYRPSITPKIPSRNTSSTVKTQQRRKPMRKSDFIWNQSMVSSTKYE